MDKKGSHASSKGKHRRNSHKVPRENERIVLCKKLFKLCSDRVDVAHLWEHYLQFLELLEKINHLKEMKTSTTKRTEAVDKFMKWLSENGIDVDGASISEFPDYEMGLKANKDFAAFEVILTIPGKVIFSTASAAPELSALQNDPLIQNVPHVALAIALLIERHKDNSKWKPYLDILPTTYSTVLYMTPTELMELKGSPMLEKAVEQNRNIVRQFAYLSEMFHNNRNAVSNLLRSNFSWEEYRWAVSTVMTRQNILPSKNGAMVHVLIPMWDMCNHEAGSITTDFDFISDTCVCYAKRSFKQGDQIFISYGHRSNADFFAFSGFVYPDNENDTFELALGISKADPLYKERMDLLKQIDPPYITQTFPLRLGNQPIGPLMLAFLRIFSMRKTELDHWLQSGKVPDLRHPDCALETVVEENAKKFLLTRLKLLIANYPTTLEEDLVLVKTPMHRKRLMSIQLRISEKRILHGVLEYVEQWMKA